MNPLLSLIFIKLDNFKLKDFNFFAASLIDSSELRSNDNVLIDTSFSAAKFSIKELNSVDSFSMQAIRLCFWLNK